ncbi:MAG: hypothetical protein AAGJ18_20610 [Bacteroidota bacterium]
MKKLAFINDQFIQEKNNIFTLTDSGKLLADKIALELFMEEE